jgi:D-alanyl-D-alanine carboxypeptidase
MGLPGISVAIGNTAGLLWAGTAGYDDIAQKTPITPDTRFGIGSITKTFVAVVALQLTGEGKLDLDKTVMDYLHDHPIVHRIPNAYKATLYQLLNHTSGIPTWEFQPKWIRQGRGDQMILGHVWDKMETLDYITDDKASAAFEPGHSYAYSNTNYTLLGLIIETVTGNELIQEIRRRVLEPLNMTNTFMDSFETIPGGISHHYHYATPMFARDAGIHSSFSELYPYIIETSAANLSPEWAAGGMVTSASDLMRFARALRDGKLLSAAMQAEMFTYHPTADVTSSDHHPPEYMQGISRERASYSLYPLVGHSGGTIGFTAMMYWLEEKDLIVVAMTNIGHMHSGLVISPMKLFNERVFYPAVARYAHLDVISP